jgi:heterodisulfide reductase subunit A
MSQAPENLIGSVMVVGGGIAGVQAALDLAETGYYVYMVENSEAIGGVMSALDKTFPTNDCSMCILSPKLVECGRHPNIEILTMTDIMGIEGEAGNFRVDLHQRPRYIDMEKCIACGTCAEKCPRKSPDEYNLGLNKRKAAYVKYPQAVPLKYVIERDNCIYFEKGKCKACEKYCPADAVDFSQEAKDFTIETGAVILAPGFETFDASNYEEYVYARHPNVVSSMEFERILSASGPFQGDLKRPSDGKEPERIAWFQCVGSRDVHHCDNGYCSGVCCMYAIKEAVIAREHAHNPLDATIFFMDMRTSGKDFEKYYWRAEEEHGVRFVRSRVHTVIPDPETGNLQIHYVTEDGTPVEEEFDLIVLSVGMQTSKGVADLAGRLGVDLNSDRFAATRPFTPVTTSRPGIYVCGAFQGPKDIPQSVMEASAAAAESSALLAPARNTVAKTPAEIAERDVSGEEPRVGVFVCHCGINIGAVVDVPDVKEYAKTLPNVAYVEENLFTCSQDTQDKMKQVINEHNLNRIVVASCSPRTHEPLFQQTIREAGLNKYMFELANIRDQNSWVHQGEPEKATDKAKDLVRMAVAKAALQEPLHEYHVDVHKSALVIGGGAAGMAATLGLADQGYPVHLVERGEQLGGNARKLITTWDGTEVAPALEEMIGRINGHEHVTVHLDSEVKDVSGFVGNFRTKIAGNGGETEIDHGAAIVAVGGQALRPNEYLYGEDDRVMLLLELDEALKERHDTLPNTNCAVFIQCVGSREPDRPYCSRVCCTHSVESAIRLKELNPEMDVYVLYRDIRTYGRRENLYKKAREKGVMFIRFDLDNKPKVEVGPDGDLQVTVFEPILQRPMMLKPDLLTLASAVVPSESEKLAKMFKVPLNAEGFFLEAHMKLRPVDFATEGVYVCGLAHWPKPTEECIAQAKAAAGRAATVLAQDSILAGGVVAAINKSLCCGCQACVECCPFGAIDYIEQENVCEVNQAVCKGCGTCAATCPSEAISLMGFNHLQLYAQIDEALSA